MKYPSTLHTYADQRPTVIGLGGYLRSGKDTVADFLVEHRGFVKLGMSDTLALALYTQNPWIHVDGWDGAAALSAETGWSAPAPYVQYQALVDNIGYVNAKKIPEVRIALQVLGTEVGRKLLGENIWVHAAERRIAEHTNEGASVVITGIRFTNEIRMLQSIGGWPIWVERNDAAVEASMDAAAVHSSERTLSKPDFDFSIRNEGTLTELEQLTQHVVSTLEAQRKSHAI